MKYEIRRQQLINTAVESVRTNGWAATDHRSIAVSIGMAATTVYSHFPKRRDLRHALVNEAPEDVIAAVLSVIETEPRMKPKDRKRLLLSQALALAEEIGYESITLGKLAKCAGVSHTLYVRYFGSIHRMRNEIMRAAVKRGNLTVIAQGLSRKDPHALRAPDDVKRAAVQTLIG